MIRALVRIILNALPAWDDVLGWEDLDGVDTPDRRCDQRGEGVGFVSNHDRSNAA